jgi:hypothetical protein
MTGWRTVIAAGLVIVAGALQAAGTVDWIALVGADKAGAIVSGIGVAFGILRYITTTPIGKAG